MLGMIGITAVLGCALAAIISVVGSIVVAGVSIGVAAAQANQAEQLQDEMLAEQEKAQDEAKDRLNAQKEAAFRQQERANYANVMAMGSAILAEKFRSKEIRFETTKTMSQHASSHLHGKYNYGKPVQPTESSAQSQNQANP